jgi:hypothetical protein
MNNIIETIKRNDLLKIALVGLAIYLYFTYFKKETLDNQPADQEPVPEKEETKVESQTTEEKVSGAEFQAKPQLVADDLLPKYDESNEFAKQNPVSNLLKEQNFLIGGYHTGVSTHINSSRISYRDLRSSPAIPKDTSLSVWNVSSYEEAAGAGRKKLEIGA